MITNNEFKLNLNTLSHIVVGGTRYSQRLSITIPRTVLVLDVSKWQGEINFVKMKAAGVDGVIIKCGQGTEKDPCFDVNWQRAKEAGLARGSYWFWDSRVSPYTQASNWWDWIKADPGELKHYGDYEESYGGSRGGWQNFKTFMTAMASWYRVDKLGIYTGYYYWISNSPNPLTNSGSLNWFGQFELWLAWYTTNPANVLIPKPWTKLTLWQYGTMGVDGQTPNGIKYGTQSIEVDENNFDGDDIEYKEHYDLEVETQEPPTEPPVEPPGEPMPTVTTYYLTVTASPAKRWSDAACTNRIYPDIPNGTKLESQVKSGSNYYIGNGYVKGSQVHLDYVETVEEPTEPPVEPPVEPPQTTTLPETLKGFDATGTEIPGAIWDKRNAP